MVHLSRIRLFPQFITCLHHISQHKVAGSLRNQLDPLDYVQQLACLAPLGKRIVLLRAFTFLQFHNQTTAFMMILI